MRTLILLVIATSLWGQGTDRYQTHRRTATGAVSRTLAGILDDLPVSVMDFGAKRDCATDDTASFQAAIDSRPNGGNIYAPTGCYRIDGTVVLKRSHLLVGTGMTATMLHCTGPGVCIAQGDVGTGVMNNIQGGMRELSLVGAGISDPYSQSDGTQGGPAGTIGLFLGGDPAGVVTPSTAQNNMSVYSNITVRGFDDGVRLGNNAYIITFVASQLRENIVGFRADYGTTNAGENLSFHGGLIGNNAYAGILDNAGAEFNLNGVSVDYNQASGAGQAIIGDALRVSASNCHFEQFWGPVIVTGGHSYISIFGGMIVLLGVGTPPAGSGNVVWINNATQQHQLSIRDTEIGFASEITNFVYFNASAQSSAIVQGLKNNYANPHPFAVLNNVSDSPAIVDAGSQYNSGSALMRYSNRLPLETHVAPPGSSTNTTLDSTMIGGHLRYMASLNGQETGSDAGSNLTWSSYSDSGAFLTNFLQFTRATGAASFGTAAVGYNPVGMGTLTLNSEIGSKVDLNFSSGGNLKWQWDKNTDDSFSLWDAAGSRTAMKFDSGGAASFGVAGNYLPVNTGSLTINSTAGSRGDLNFSSSGALKWQWDKNTDDSFALWDAAGSRNAVKFPGSGEWASFYGAVQLGGISQPSCSAGNAGIVWYSGHSTGVKDSVAVCAADATNTYSWRTIY